MRLMIAYFSSTLVCLVSFKQGRFEAWKGGERKKWGGRWREGVDKADFSNRTVYRFKIPVQQCGTGTRTGTTFRTGTHLYRHGRVYASDYDAIHGRVCVCHWLWCYSWQSVCVSSDYDAIHGRVCVCLSDYADILSGDWGCKFKSTNLRICLHAWPKLLILHMICVHKMFKTGHYNVHRPEQLVC